VTEPRGPDVHPEPEREPAPAVVAWGGEPSSRGSSRLAGWSGRLRPDWLGVRVLAGLAGLVLFGSLLDSWQETGLPEEFSEPARVAGLPGIGAWGAGWLVGLIGLAACTGLTVLGLPALRAPARSAGLALAGVQLGLLAAMSVQLGRTSTLESTGFIAPGEIGFEVQLGRGVYLAYLGLGLAAAALWWARPEPRPAAPDPVRPASAPASGDGYAGPPDLMVGPAEPFTHPDRLHG